MASRLEDRLRRFADRQGVSLSSMQIEQLVRLERMLTEWNVAVDLSGFRDEDARFDRYLAEPLDAARWLPPGPGAALDVGSGGGSPALPLAVARPGDRWTLLEPNRRRAVFLEEALVELGLAQARVVRARWEDFVPEAPLLTVTSRGVALSFDSLPKMAEWLEPGGRLLLFTGEDRAEELLESGSGSGRLHLEARVALAPGLKGWLVVFEKK